MKIDFSVELDFIDEDTTISEAIKDELIKACSKEIIRVANGRLNSIIDTLVENTQQQVDTMMKEFLTNFASKEIVRTDDWGNVKERLSVEQAIQQRIDQCLSDRIDSRGNVSKSGSMTLVEWWIKQNVDPSVSRKMDMFQRDVEQLVKKKINETAKEKLSESLIKFMDLDIEELIKKVQSH